MKPIRKTGPRRSPLRWQRLVVQFLQLVPGLYFPGAELSPIIARTCCHSSATRGSCESS
jgi:hypothetical protein